MNTKNNLVGRSLKKPKSSLTKLEGLEPISTKNMTDQVEERLRKYFIQKGYKIGDAIPKEQELATALNVSRNIVREAISRLRMLGIIESRKRRGMILTEPDIMNSLERFADSRMLLSRESLKELFELRLTIEIGMSDLLFLRKNNADIAKLDKIVKEEQANALTKEQQIKYEIAFHGTLYQMAGNDTLCKFQKMLVYLFEYALEEMNQVEESKRHGSVKHADLVKILKKGDVDQFRIAMKKHLEPYFLMLQGK